MGVTTKWYIEPDGGSFHTFHDLALVFLNQFQLPIRYDANINLISMFKQDKVTHISDHIQQWRRRKRLIKAKVPPEFLLEWLLKYLLPYISIDVSTSGLFSK